MQDRQLSVLICTHDRPAALARCLESVQRQTHKPDEIVVVHNGPGPASLPSAMTCISPTRLVWQAELGLSRARNAVWPILRGEWVALLDDDAIAAPGWLAATANRFADDEVGCITGPVTPWDESDAWQRKQSQVSWARYPETELRFTPDNFDPLRSRPGAGTNLVVRHAALPPGGWPEFLGPGTPAWAADEHYVFFDLIRRGWHIVYEPRAVVAHDYPTGRPAWHRRMFRASASRSAYLAQLLLLERDQSWRTLRGILAAGARGRAGAPEIPRCLRALALLYGPLALARARHRARPGREPPPAPVLVDERSPRS